MELQILHWFESLHTPILNYFMYGVTLLGESGIFWIILAVLMLFVFPARYRKVGLTMAIALILSLIFCNLLIKNIVARDRPFWTDPSFENLFGIFDSLTDYCFPSGHSSASFAAATSIVVWRKKEGIAALVIAALIAVSRLYLCVHYPTDVLAGIILGLIFGFAAYCLVRLICRKFRRFELVFTEESPYSVLFRGTSKNSIT